MATQAHSPSGLNNASPIVELPRTLAYIMGAPAAPRSAVEALLQRAIDELDEIDGDTDMEDDDPAGQCDEDGINTALGSLYYYGLAGPGCPIADPDEGVEDKPHDPEGDVGI
ncbi:hypothetical protein [Croceibacterium aestuarii]|uniref:hypothetical protein n=1 Tax=Croceibacterium aestuarii TaxID=3064139 RepID=UPI00272EB649|nr:hypothetical protein [Croceibacterium sp. D39]